jgi:hypothetical protein
MPLLDVQQQHATMFRLRFGDQVTSRGKSRPRRLTDQIRVTSPNPAIVDAFCAVYGGERRGWDNQGRAEFEAYLPTTAIRVVLLPGSSLSQWWELYRGSVCVRRCDSQTELKSGKPCLCPSRDPAERNADPDQCSATTRVSVICPDVDVVGAGMFVTRGLMAASMLPNAIAAANAALAAGIYVPAVVRVVECTGQGTKWVVPQIEVVGTSLERLLRSAIEARQHNGGQLDGTAPKILGWEPRAAAAIEAGEVPSLRAQLGTVDEPPARRARKNAQTPIPPTGRAPRTAAEAGTVDDPVDVVEIVEVVDGDNGTRPNRVAIAARQAGLDDDGRHDLAEWVSGGRTRSSKDLTGDEIDRAVAACDQIRAGTAALRRVDSDDGTTTTVQLIDTRFGWPTDVQHAPERQVDPAGADGDLPALSAEQIGEMRGPDLIAALRARGVTWTGTKKPAELRAMLLEACGLGDEPF